MPLRDAGKAEVKWKSKWVGGIPELAALKCCQKEISVKLQISQGFGSLNRLLFSFSTYLKQED